MLLSSCNLRLYFAVNSTADNVAEIENILVPADANSIIFLINLMKEMNKSYDSLQIICWSGKIKKYSHCEYQRSQILNHCMNYFWITAD